MVARNRIVSVLRRFYSDFRLQLLTLVVGVELLLLSIARISMFLTMPERFSELQTPALFYSLLIGVRYDLVVALLLALPLALAIVLIPQRQLVHFGPRAILQFLALTAFGLCAATTIVDYFYFEEFFTHLDHKVFQYIGYDYVWATIWQQFPIVPAVLGVVSSTFACKYFFRARQWSGAAELPSFAFLPLFVPIFFLGIRSSLGPKPINSGLAYQLPSIAAAQLSLNGLFTLREAFDGYFLRGEQLSDLLPLLPEEEARRLAQAVLLPEHEVPLGTSNPIARISVSKIAQRDLNVVVVILESFSWHYVGAMGGDARVSTNLDALIAESVFFDRCFAVGDRTVHGVSGIVSGFPDLPGDSVTTRYQSHGNLQTLGSVLAERGYETMFIYGGSPLYDHRGAFLGSNGYSRLHFGDQFQSQTFRTHLGYSDEDLFSEAERVFAENRTKPFHALLLTLSFHRPFEIPADRVTAVPAEAKESRQLTAVKYTDWALGQFMKRMKQTEYYQDTLFVFVADHTGGIRGNTFNPESYRVPLLLHAPKYLPPSRNGTICSQTDIAPTILDVLGGQSTHSFFGSSLLERPNGQALMLFGSRSLGYLSSGGQLVVLPMRAEGEGIKTFELTSGADFRPTQSQATGLQRDAISLLQAADAVYRSQTD